MFRAIGRLLRWIWSGLDGLRKVLHLVLLLALFAIAWGLFSRPIPLVPDKAALVVDPQGPLVEQLSGDPMERALARTLRNLPTETLLRDLVDAIEAAADDDRISSLYLDLGGLDGGGLAKLKEVAAAIDDFRATGKPVIAYGDFYEQNQYYLAAHADEIYLDPAGAAYVDGYANFGLFVKDALDKLSVDLHIFRVGEYKSAVETFSRNDMSPAEREESLAWLGAVWNTYKTDVAAAREFEPARLQAYADDAAQGLRKAGGDLAKMALDAGLVTSLKGRFEVEDRIAEITGEDEDTHSYVGVDFDSYLANVDSEQALRGSAAQKVAVIVAAGDIVPGEGAPGMIGSDTLAAQLRDAAHDDAIKAVVLRIDSPGGSVFASEVIRREVAALRKTGKPVVASMSSLAASGGYYIAMEADKIVASPATLTGSIGVFFMMPTFQRSLERLGVHTDGVGTTALAGEFRRGPAAGGHLERRPAADHRPQLPGLHRPRGQRRARCPSRRSTRSRRGASGRGRTRSGSGSSTSSAAMRTPLSSPRGSRSWATTTTSSTSTRTWASARRWDCGSASRSRAWSRRCCRRARCRSSRRCSRPCCRRRSGSRRLSDPGNVYAYCLACSID